MRTMNKSVETIYALTDIQQGILYHSQYEENQGEYILENTFMIKGCLDAERVKSSLAALSQKYEVLRALFLYKKTSEPKMVILKKRTPEFVCLGYEKIFTKEEFEQKAIHTPRLETVPDQWTSQICARILAHHKVILVSDLVDPQLVKDMHMDLATTVDEALQKAFEIKGKDAKVAVIPDGLGVVVNI